MGHIHESSDLADNIKLGGRELEAVSSDVSDHVLADFDHQDTVITFSSDRGMGTGEVGSELVDGQVAHSTTTFTADGDNTLAIPAHHSFDDAADTEEFIFVAFRILENVLASVVHALKSHGAR